MAGAAVLSAVVEEVLKTLPVLKSHRSVGGGCINQCYRVEANSQVFFIKLNEERRKDMFQKEFQGLQTLMNHTSLGVPRPLGWGAVLGRSYLVMEYLEPGVRSSHYWSDLAEGLSQLHGCTGPAYGWENDNYIGRLPQSNRWHNSWVGFFIQERLEPQIKMAQSSGLMPATTADQFASLFTKLESLLLAESPALLHGDLWSGNLMAGPDGRPCLVDPAVYYGHREVELAFTTLFGGFHEDFYREYRLRFPLEEGFEDRFELYNLYPLLVHLNLFGTGYLGDIKNTLKRYV